MGNQPRPQSAGARLVSQHQRTRVSPALKLQDTTMLLLVAVTIPAIAGLVILAAAVTAARLSLTIQVLRPILTS